MDSSIIFPESPRRRCSVKGREYNHLPQAGGMGHPDLPVLDFDTHDAFQGEAEYNREYEEENEPMDMPSEHG